ncbi:MAG: hypothetical protein AVDCRST_MAG95-1649 [uncultured Adhaeribacter sp.]|uniref:Uncharacterized protein n=1 Tax=uncultured Adhaeribacter sp. TaxID=448109 RepID=A0A6J4I9V9_9BACT|nr:MAG: hypothetical protein AVDCRST_MAG95-1649 [uncultured Adhaeribacter sp.]
MAIIIPNDVPTRTWENGLAYHGAARTALDKACSATGLAWSIQNGTLQIIRSGGNTNRTVFDLGVESGLVGSPERLRRGSQEVLPDDPNADPKKSAAAQKAKSRQFVSPTQEEDGWRVRSLILPSLVPGDRVKISSRTIEGVFTIRNLLHMGDTRGGEWVTELKLIDPKPATTDTRAQAPAPRTRVRQSNSGGQIPLPPPDPGPVPSR